MITENPSTAYTGTQGAFAVYGFEYKPGLEEEGGYVTYAFPFQMVAQYLQTSRSRWINDNKRAWTFRAGGMGANAATEISARPVPREPMVWDASYTL